MQSSDMAVKSCHEVSRTDNLDSWNATRSVYLITYECTRVMNGQPPELRTWFVCLIWHNSDKFSKCNGSNIKVTRFQWINAVLKGIPRQQSLPHQRVLCDRRSTQHIFPVCSLNHMSMHGIKLKPLTRTYVISAAALTSRYILNNSIYLCMFVCKIFYLAWRRNGSCG